MPPDESAWAEAQRICALSDEDIRMARELGLQPAFLSAPVSAWIRVLYEQKKGSTVAAGNRVVEFRNPDYPWPDRPEIRERVVEDPFDPDDDEDGEDEEGGEERWGFPAYENRYGPPSEADVEDQNTLMLRYQCRYRWAAQWVAIAMSQLPEVSRVAAFGAVAQPLKVEIPRFHEYRRHRIKILHECSDLDLAVWTNDLSRLKPLKNALNRSLPAAETNYGGGVHHQVDVHLFDAVTGAYRGRLCSFSQCPKPHKHECLVPGCGAQPFLQLFEDYRFNLPRFEGEPKVILFDRAAGFLVHPPRMDTKLTRFVRRGGKKDDGVQ